jgi:hypothetical protein
MTSTGKEWNIDRAVLVIGGSVVLLSLGLSQLHSEYWLWLTAFAGANMLQSAFTGFCPPALLLRKLGMQSGCVFSGKEGNS